MFPEPVNDSVVFLNSTFAAVPVTDNGFVPDIVTVVTADVNLSSAAVDAYVTVPLIVTVLGFWMDSVPPVAVAGTSMLAMDTVVVFPIVTFAPVDLK